MTQDTLKDKSNKLVDWDAWDRNITNVGYIQSDEYTTPLYTYNADMYNTTGSSKYAYSTNTTPIYTYDTSSTDSYVCTWTPVADYSVRELMEENKTLKNEIIRLKEVISELEDTLNSKATIIKLSEDDKVFEGLLDLMDEEGVG